jgi:hypothetical protein
VVELESNRWSHIQGHVEDPDAPWEDALGRPLYRDLRASYAAGVSPEQQETLRTGVSEWLRLAACECLNVPLAVVCDVLQSGQQSSDLTALLVLRCGAQLCIREFERARWSVRTCFFPPEVQAVPQDRRWRFLVRDLIQRYARRNSNGTYSPPDASWGIWENPVTKETLANPRFRSNQCWGLDRPIVDPWFGMSDPWPPPPPPARPAVSLPRRGRY